MAGVAQLVELWIVIPMLPSDISDLSPKTCGQMRTNGLNANADKCRQIERKNMENFEGWDPHPTRKNIFIDQEDWSVI